MDGDRVRARRWTVAILVCSCGVWAGGGFVSPRVAPAPAGQRGEAAKPEYDLAVLAIEATLRWQGGLEEFARFDVPLANRGARLIDEEQVECVVAGRTFRGLETGRLLRPGEIYQFTVQVKGREVATLAPGRYPAACTASIVRPAGARDAVPENDRATGVVMVPAPPKPDLMPQALALRDCETLAPVVAGRPACLEVTFINLGGALVTPWSVACDLGGLRIVGAGPTPVDKGAVGTVTLPAAPQPAGERAAACTLDEGGAVDERDETNNFMRGAVLVLPDTGTVQYDLALTAIESTLTEVRDPETRQPSVVLGVRVKNLGNQPVLRAESRCEVAGTELVLAAATTAPLAPGEEQTIQVQAWGRRLASLPAGRHEVTCVTGIAQPLGVVETDVANNALTGTVAVKR